MLFLMDSPTSALALRQWIANMRAAESRARQARRETPLSPTESLLRACELWEFAKQIGAPPANDDENRVQATWATLRRAWGAP